MTAKTRLVISLLAGVLAGGALTWFEATKRHARLAAAVAKLAAHGRHESATSVLATGFAATTLIVATAVFAAATVWQRRRYRRALAVPMTGRSRHNYGGYSDYGGGW
jgi:hypothetical protein